jgi:mono/diheme cytochrome c family protein
VQLAIGTNAGGMGSLSRLSVAEVQAIVAALTPATPTPPPATPDGPSLYSSNCAGCHGVLAGSTKGGATAERIQAAIAGNVGGMGPLSRLTAAEIQAIASALASVAPPVVTDGPTLYGSYCASCHGALASSTKGGATAARIQAAISGNTGGMGSLSTLSATQVTAIAEALASIPPTSAACGSCHAIPPATGRHAKHRRLSCSNCHGVGYSSTSFAAATHNNRVVNLVGTIGWVSTSKTCSNSCHGKESWIGESDD